MWEVFYYTFLELRYRITFEKKKLLKKFGSRYTLLSSLISFPAKIFREKFKELWERNHSKTNISENINCKKVWTNVRGKNCEKHSLKQYLTFFCNPIFPRHYLRRICVWKKSAKKVLKEKIPRTNILRKKYTSFKNTIAQKQRNYEILNEWNKFCLWNVLQKLRNCWVKFFLGIKHFGEQFFLKKEIFEK